MRHRRWTGRKYAWLSRPVSMVSSPGSPRKPSRRRCFPHWTLRPGTLWTGTVHLETEEKCRLTSGISKTSGMTDTFLLSVMWRSVRTYFDWTTVSRTTPSISKARRELTCSNRRILLGKVLKSTDVPFDFTDMLVETISICVLPQFVIFLGQDAVIWLLQ